MTPQDHDNSRAGGSVQAINHNCRKEDAMINVPVWEKANLTLEEAAAYFGVGINKLREITNDDKCKFVLWVGNKRLIKRKQCESYFNAAYSI